MNTEKNNFLTFNGKSGYIYLQLVFFPLVVEQTVLIAKRTMKSIYKYIDYRKYLKDFYDESKAAKHYFSYRFFAQRAGLKAPILLKLVIDGKRNLSRKAIDKFITGMGLKEKEAIFPQPGPFQPGNLGARKAGALPRTQVLVEDGAAISR
jgi:hypothetical protein